MIPGMVKIAFSKNFRWCTHKYAMLMFMAARYSVSAKHAVAFTAHWLIKLVHYSYFRFATTLLLLKDNMKVNLYKTCFCTVSRDWFIWCPMADVHLWMQLAKKTRYTIMDESICRTWQCLLNCIKGACFCFTIISMKRNMSRKADAKYNGEQR